MKNNKLEHHKKLPYSIEIKPIPHDQGGGYMAIIPELGKMAFVGDGETPMEALQHLEEVTKDLFLNFREQGISSLEPKPKRVFA